MKRCIISLNILPAKLSYLSKYESEQFEPEFVNITSASAGTLSPINPLTNLYKNNTVRFDLSDPSLASFVGVSSYSAFDLNLYTDVKFENEFILHLLVILLKYPKQEK